MIRLLAVDSPTILFVAGALLIGFVLLRRSQRAAGRTKAAPVGPPDRPHSMPTSHHLDASGTQARWEVEMHELARDLAGQLDSKIVIVECLIQDAQRAAARLEAVMARAEQAGLWQRHSGRPDEDAITTSDNPPAPGAGRGRQRVAGMPPEAEAIAGNADAHEDSRLDGAALDRVARVYALADGGLRPAAIAAEIEQPLGEVELILSVRSRAGN